MAFRTIQGTVTRPDVRAVLQYDGRYEYRVRLEVSGVIDPNADYFTDDKEDAVATARVMANRAYARLRTKRADSIAPHELKRLREIATCVWQAIAPDCGEIDDNEVAVELCFDADRPLLANPNSKNPEADHLFCKLMFATYSFDAVRLAVSRNLQLI